MGDQELGEGGNGIAQSSYSVILYPAAQVPVQYINLILSKWMRTLRHGNEYFKLTESDSFYQNYRRYILSLLNRPQSVVRLAVLSDDHDVCLGWSLIEGDVLHYIFVQHEHRNQGIGRSLVPVKINYITHVTKAGLSAWNKKLPAAAFDPFK